jgi:hypothetical protein
MKTEGLLQVLFDPIKDVVKDMELPGVTVNQHPPVHHEGWMVSGQEQFSAEILFPS